MSYKKWSLTNRCSLKIRRFLGVFTNNHKILGYFKIYLDEFTVKI